jgi:hypothetical protein
MVALSDMNPKRETKVLKPVVLLVAALFVVASPAAAWACPYCAAGARGGSGMSVALGAFLLLPFVIAGVVFSVLRREAE